MADIELEWLPFLAVLALFGLFASVISVAVAWVCCISRAGGGPNRCRQCRSAAEVRRVFARVSCRKPKSATTSTATTNGRVATVSGSGGAGTNNVNHVMYSGKAAEIANKYGLSHQQQQQQQNGGAGSPVSSGGSGSPQPIPKIIVTTASMKRRPYQDYY